MNEVRKGLITRSLASKVTNFFILASANLESKSNAVSFSVHFFTRVRLVSVEMSKTKSGRLSRGRGRCWLRKTTL